MGPGGRGEGNRKGALRPEKISKSFLEEVTPELSVEGGEETQEGVPSGEGSFFFLLYKKFLLS